MRLGFYCIGFRLGSSASEIEREGGGIGCSAVYRNSLSPPEQLFISSEEKSLDASFPVLKRGNSVFGSIFEDRERLVGLSNLQLIKDIFPSWDCFLFGHY